MTDLNRRRRFITNSLYWAVIAFLVYAVCHWLLGIIAPFLCAFLFAWLLQAPIRFLTVRFHMRYGLAAALCLTLFFGVFCGLLTMLAVGIVTGAQDLMQNLPDLYANVIEPNLTALMERLERAAVRIDPASSSLLEEHLPDILSSVGGTLANIPVQLMTSGSNWAAKLPLRLLSMVVCVIATVFITLDFSRISAFVLRQLPEKVRYLMRQARDSASQVLRSYCRSYGIILCITFAELAVGLLLLRQRNAIVIALIVAVLDIFPVLGTGLVLVPWGLIALLGGQTAKGIGLLALWLVILVVRQIIEPRILGHQVGLHPVVALTAMFLGARLFGAAGLMLLPVACAVLKSLDDSGVIHLIRRPDGSQD